MKKTTSINVRVEEELKAESEKVMAEFGLNMTTTVNMLLRQIVREQAIPLSLTRNDDNRVMKDILFSQLQRANGYDGLSGEESADRLDKIISEVENGAR